MISALMLAAVGSRHTTRVSETGLLARAQGNDPTVAMVSMCETKTVDIAPGQNMDVFTCAFCGCTTVAVISKHRDGNRTVTLSNYPPVYANAQLSALGDALQTTSHDADNSSMRHEVFVITPDDGMRDHEGRWTPGNAQQELVSSLTKTVRAHLPFTQPTLLPYRDDSQTCESRAFVVSVPSDIDAPMRYYGIHDGVCGF